MSSPKYTSPYELDGRIPLKQAIPLGLQHVLAMFVGNLSPLLIIMGVCSITAGEGLGDLRVSLLQNAMFIAGVVTLLQLYPIGPIGGKLPIVMGTSSGFIGVNNGIAVATLAGISAGTITTNVAAGIYTYGVIMGACLIGGAFEMVLGFCIKPLRKFFRRWLRVPLRWPSACPWFPSGSAFSAADLLLRITVQSGTWFWACPHWR